MAKCEIVMVRLTPAERAKLRNLAETLNSKPSTVLRHLLYAVEVEPPSFVFPNLSQPGEEISPKENLRA